jgi:hypothetical protein
MAVLGLAGPSSGSDGTEFAFLQFKIDAGEVVAAAHGRDRLRADPRS